MPHSARSNRDMWSLEESKPVRMISDDTAEVIVKMPAKMDGIDKSSVESIISHHLGSVAHTSDRRLRHCTFLDTKRYVRITLNLSDRSMPDSINSAVEYARRLVDILNVRAKPSESEPPTKAEMDRTDDIGSFPFFGHGRTHEGLPLYV